MAEDTIEGLFKGDDVVAVLAWLEEHKSEADDVFICYSSKDSNYHWNASGMNVHDLIAMLECIKFSVIQGDYE